ncbi:thioredoxin domain-containing protein [Galactobacter sp.]|uniref:DsbA family protein n=1 Tax=Galactobacter sp. TaxID=2676125 RepID=UPI0025C1F2D7|nr:thioredoxin domain-containing protein [Galactobacter sp.]
MRRALTLFTAVLAGSALALAGCTSKLQAPGPASGAASSPSAMPDGTEGPSAPSSGSSGTGQAQGASGAPRYGTEAGGVVSAEEDELVPLEDLPEPADAADSGPVDGKVRVIVYQDLMCPYCKQFDDNFGETLAKWAEDGDVVVDHRVVSILDGMSTTQYSTRVAGAMACVADEAPSSYTAVLRAYYKAQGPKAEGGLDVSEGSAGLTDQQLTELAEAQGAPESVGTCIQEQRFASWVKASTARASANDVRATPTVLVAGQAWDSTDTDFEAWARKVIDAES